jgi:hypothetical protein
MQEWKVRQDLYHRLEGGVGSHYADDLSDEEIVITKEVAKDALRHFNENVDQWIYPAKSYVVAFCYAYWISQDFNEDMKDLLNDPQLLFDCDPYFVTYDNDPETYDFLFENVKLPIPMEGMVSDIREYYVDEILFD